MYLARAGDVACVRGPHGDSWERSEGVQGCLGNGGGPGGRWVIVAD